MVDEMTFGQVTFIFTSDVSDYVRSRSEDKDTRRAPDSPHRDGKHFPRTPQGYVLTINLLIRLLRLLMLLVHNPRFWVSLLSESYHHLIIDVLRAFHPEALCDVADLQPLSGGSPA